MVFLANELPPLGFKSYFISSPPTNDQQPEAILMDQPHTAHGYFAEDGTVSIGNKYINLTFDANGQLESITSNGATSKLKQTFFYYEGASGNNRVFVNRSSGAYIFRPNSTERIISEKVIKHDNPIHSTLTFSTSSLFFDPGHDNSNKRPCCRGSAPGETSFSWNNSWTFD